VKNVAAMHRPLAELVAWLGRETSFPDGVVLLGNHYRPAGPVRPRPVVLLRSPYGRAGMAGLLFAAPLARRGFQVFIQSTRGTFGSGGLFRPFSSEREDGLATVSRLVQSNPGKARAQRDVASVKPQEG